MTSSKCDGVNLLELKCAQVDDHRGVDSGLQPSVEHLLDLLLIALLGVELVESPLFVHTHSGVVVVHRRLKTDKVSLLQAHIKTHE